MRGALLETGLGEPEPKSMADVRRTYAWLRALGCDVRWEPRDHAECDANWDRVKRALGFDSRTEFAWSDRPVAMAPVGELAGLSSMASELLAGGGR